MYNFMLNLHSYLRWAVVIIGVIAVLMAWAGVFSRARWTPQQLLTGRLATIAFDTQALVGVLLYAWLSPITTGAFRDMGAAMKDAGVRFYVAEHSLIMIVAAVLIHIGALRARKKDSPLQAAIFYTLAMAGVLALTPWGRG
ncbi:MAG: hypothetical protein KJ049_06220 [Gammaproteobacteria bacterium]|nr:hypothetical protein [Gammaproteobacteria bacterium]